MTKYYFYVLLIFIFILASCINTSENLSGRDKYGCLTSSDFQWCSSKEKCVRAETEYCQEYADKFIIEAKDLVLRMSDLSGGYDLVEENELSIDEGSEEIVNISRKAGLKSKHLVEFKSDTLLNSEEPSIEIIQLVQVFENKGIELIWDYTKNDFQKVVEFSNSKNSSGDGWSLTWKYFETPIIGDGIVAVVNEHNSTILEDIEYGIIPIWEQTSSKQYMVTYIYKNMLVKITIRGNESSEEKAISFAKLSLDKIKKYEASLND